MIRVWDLIEGLGVFGCRIYVWRNLSSTNLHSQTLQSPSIKKFTLNLIRVLIMV